MAEAFPANRREAILAFHFADRIKAEILLASRLLNAVIQMEGLEKEGAGKLFLDFLRGLEQEINIAAVQIGDSDMIRVRTVMAGLIGMADSNMFADIQEHLTWMISTMTTYAQRAMEYLVKEKLL
jgi:aspartyl aminopeptidase